MRSIKCRARLVGARRWSWSTPLHHVLPPWLAAGLADGRRWRASATRAGGFTRDFLEGRLGFEPRTRGLKVSRGAVHGDVWRHIASLPRAASVHPVHRMTLTATAVAVSVAVGAVCPRRAGDKGTGYSITAPQYRLEIRPPSEDDFGASHSAARAVRSPAHGRPSQPFSSDGRSSTARRSPKRCRTPGRRRPTVTQHLRSWRWVAEPEK